MLTRTREGTPDAAREGGPDPLRAHGEEGIGGAAVDVEGLAHSFGELQVIQRIDLQAEPGEILGIVGPSGCGKTTLLELVAGLREAGSGALSVGGHAEASERLE